VAFGLVTRRRADAMGIIVLAALAASAALSAVSGSPRALLARDGLTTAAWAGYMYLSLLTRRARDVRGVTPAAGRTAGLRPVVAALGPPAAGVVGRDLG
jgi:hypothetical protein